jgi:tRNA-2-methylthio-N6-dimethylallyladenosine synthase
MKGRFFIETFGCQMNELDSQKIAGNLIHGGMTPAPDASQADVIILNTCAVREKAVQKVYAHLGEIKGRKNKKHIVVGIVGCMAQIESEKILKRAPFVNVLAGPQKGNMICELIDRTLTTHAPVIELRRDEDPEPLETPYIFRENSWRANVTISEGCNCRCAFCVVPFTRGRERTRDCESIIREVRDLSAQGFVEIVLLGQTVNSYRDPRSREITFARLLRKLAQVEGIKRIRFTSPHPNSVDDELVEAMVESPQICNQIHMPLQSGSTRILRKMKRGYTSEQYLEKIGKIRAASRPIAISTDIIVGFPGETERDFQDTLTLLDEVQYDYAFSFKYSARPNTEALAFQDDVPEDEKGTRLGVLQERQKLIQYNKNSAYMDQEMEILVDDRAKSRYALSGRTTTNKVVNFDGPLSLLGKIVSVKIEGFSANSLKGVWLQKEHTP